MRFLPFHRLTLRSEDPPEIVEARLASLVATAWFSLRTPREPFRGSVKGRRFKMVRVLSPFLGLPRYNSWQPVILGDITPAAGGTKVQVKMRLHAFVAAFQALWFAVLLAFAAILLWTGVVQGFGPADGGQGAGVGLAVVGGMMLAGYGLMSFFFWTEARKARHTLCEGLGCREVQAVNRLVRR